MGTYDERYMLSISTTPLFGSIAYVTNAISQQPSKKHVGKSYFHHDSQISQPTRNLCHTHVSRNIYVPYMLYGIFVSQVVTFNSQNIHKICFSKSSFHDIFSKIILSSQYKSYLELYRAFTYLVHAHDT